MTPGARYQAVIDLIESADAADAPLDGVLKRWAREHRYAGGGDRRAIRGLVYGIVRHRRALEWWLDRSDVRITGRSLVLAALVLLERMNAAALSNAFGAGKYAAAALDGGEHALIETLSGRHIDHSEQPRDVRLNYPAWLDPSLEAAFGPSLEEELTALSVEASVDLRVNTLKGDRAAAIARLAEDGIEAVPTPLSPVGLRLPGRVQLGQGRAWKDGLVEVQDEGSQLVALLTDAEPGSAVLDLCAGGGGKTLALAAAMQNQGRLVACDSAEARLRQIRPRLVRAGATIVAEQVVADEADPWLSGEAGVFDRVLVDAPCSGSGAWRRHPESKLTLTAETVSDMAALQRRLLATAAALVRPGGRLIYATCSILPEENDAVVDAFLAGHPSFKEMPVGDIWSRVAAGDYPCDGDRLMLTPHRHGTDGFFAAVLERVS